MAPMGLFGRKSKNKNKVSFGADVNGGVKGAVSEPPLSDNNLHHESTSSDEILSPFREPKTPVRTMSLSSDIEESHHQSEKVVDDNVDEAEYMNDSDDFDDMEDMSADPREEFSDYATPIPTDQGRNLEQNENNIMKNNKTTTINKDTVLTNVMPAIPDLDKSKSARISGRNTTPDGTAMSALVIGSNDSNSHNNSDSTKKARGKTSPTAAASLPSNKNNHDTNRSYQSSATSTSSDSVGAAKENQQVERLQQQKRRQQQQQQQEQQQLQRLQQQKRQQQQQQQHYPQQNQLLQQEIEREQTRDLVKIFIGEIWNRGEIESIQKVCSPRLRFNGHTGLERVGHDGFSRMVTTVRSSLEGYHCEIHSMVVEGRKCFCRLKFTGKHVGELMGYPPTHKLVAWMGASEFTICPRKKQILKVWELGDIKTLEAQLMS